MTDTEELRARLADPATNLADLAQISTIVRNTTEAEKHRAEVAEASNKSEHLRFWIPVLAPMFSVFAVVATLLVQFYQFRQNVRAQQMTAEDAAWRATTSALRATDGPSVPIALHGLRSFFESDRYRRDARELSIYLLGDVTRASAFQIVFPAIARATDWTTVSDLARLSHELNDTWQATEADRVEKDTAISTLSPSSAVPPGLKRDLAAATAARDEAAEELRVVTQAAVSFLRSHALDRPAAEVDFRYADLLGGDFAGLTLDNFNLENAWIEHGSIAGTSIKSTVVRNAILQPDKWQESRWDQTAWWRAQQIAPGLLIYLKQRYAYKQGQSYAHDETANAAEYQHELERLEEANKTASPTS